MGETLIGRDLGWGRVVCAEAAPPGQRGRFWLVECHECGVRSKFSTSRINAGTTSCQAGGCIDKRTAEGDRSKLYLTAMDHVLGCEMRRSIKGWVKSLQHRQDADPSFRAPSEAAIRQRLREFQTGAVEHDQNSIVYGKRGIAPAVVCAPPVRQQRVSRHQAIRSMVLDSATKLADDLALVFRQSAIPNTGESVPWAAYVVQPCGQRFADLVEGKGWVYACSLFWTDIQRQMGIQDDNELARDELARSLLEID